MTKVMTDQSSAMSGDSSLTIAYCDKLIKAEHIKNIYGQATKGAW